MFIAEKNNPNRVYFVDRGRKETLDFFPHLPNEYPLSIIFINLIYFNVVPIPYVLYNFYSKIIYNRPKTSPRTKEKKIEPLLPRQIDQHVFFCKNFVAKVETGFLCTRHRPITPFKNILLSPETFQICFKRDCSS